MHPAIRKLNKQDPPPKGCKHPGYDVARTYGRCGEEYYTVGYLTEKGWMMPVQKFDSEAKALRFILDKLYYG